MVRMVVLLPALQTQVRIWAFDEAVRVHSCYRSGMHITPEDIERRFDHHPPPDEERVEAHQGVRTVLRETAKYIVARVPPGREASLAITKLEEAMYWANAALARQNGNEPAK